MKKFLIQTNRCLNALKLLLILAGNIELCPGPVVRYSTNDTNERPRLRGFKVAHLNMRSMINKMDTLRRLVEEKSFDIFTISETWLSQSILDSEVNISGYTLVKARSRRPVWWWYSNIC
ncbi:Hypothetical predicted protein [Paramuricea clavata]|uniref:Uncharacterized protein n=1 Tax=Paramuricea clavata TaxID=317549 RepID=A0A7D9I0Y7_PARCT|nr:Hypothetical predicted protein [Paramuricea clavata]